MVSVVKSNQQAAQLPNECERLFLQALATHLPSQKDIKRWVVAHSGGLDSQVLLLIAAKTLPSSRLLVVHVNHHLQDQADAWAEFSKTQAEQLSLAFCQLDVFPKNSSENAAREARYEAFSNVLEPGDCLLMGHHADDQAETILFRMLRGSGLAGLSGIAAYRTFSKACLLRPLLACSRMSLESYGSEAEVKKIDDPSNADTRYDRNFLRHEVIPLLKRRWPKILERWQQNADLVSESNCLLEEYLDSDLSRCVGEQGELSIDKLFVFDELKRFALLRHWVFRMLKVRVNKTQLITMIADVILARRDADPRYTIANASLRRFKQHLYLVPDHYHVSSDARLSDPGEIDLGDGRLSIVPDSSGLVALSGLEVKRRQGGERCRPHGRKHSVTVKRLLHEASIPSWQKESWPMLYYGDELVAVPGICVCEGWYAENSGFSVLWRPFSLFDCR